MGNAEIEADEFVGAFRYTLIVMNATNQKLLAQTAKLTLGEPEVRGLIEKWAFLNLIRSTIPVLGTVLALAGVL